MNFDSKKVVMDTDGVPVVGFGKDSKIEVDYAEDFSELDMDVDGDFGTFNDNNNRSASIKITLKGNSPSNIIFTKYAKDKKTFDFNMVNLNPYGAKTYNGEFRIKKIPANKLGKKHEERTWELHTPKLVEN